MAVNPPSNADRTGKFSLQWIQRNPERSQSMNSVSFNVRDVQTNGGQGLTCEALYLDQLHVWYTPHDSTRLVGKFQGTDDNTKTWRTESNIVHVRVTPGERYTLLTRPSTSTDNEMVTQPVQHQVYSVSLHDTPYTGGTNEDYWSRTYAPHRDSPVSRNLFCVSEIQLDLLWPLMQGMTASEIPFPYMPGYRIERVLAEFSYH